MVHGEPLAWQQSPGSERMSAAAGMAVTEASPHLLGPAAPSASTLLPGEPALLEGRWGRTDLVLPPTAGRGVRRRELLGPGVEGGYELGGGGHPRQGFSRHASLLPPLPPAMPAPTSCRGRKVSASAGAAVWHGPGLSAPATVSRSPRAMARARPESSGHRHSKGASARAARVGTESRRRRRRRPEVPAGGVRPVPARPCPDSPR